jgi:polyferredoxin
VLVYASILLVLVFALVASLALRSPVRVDVVRDRATLARLVDGGQVENLYRLQIMNATESAQRFRIGVRGLPGIALATPDTVDIPGADARWLTVALRVPAQAALDSGPGAHPIQFDIQTEAGGAATLSEKSTFIVPR